MRMTRKKPPAHTKMAHDEVAEIISRFSYKPNSNFQYFGDGGYGTNGWVSLTLPARPVERPDVEDLLTSTMGLSLIDLNERQLVSMTESLVVQQLELHEMREWLRYEGALLQEPHPEFHAHQERLHPLRGGPTR